MTDPEALRQLNQLASLYQRLLLSGNLQQAEVVFAQMMVLARSYFLLAGSLNASELVTALIAGAAASTTQVAAVEGIGATAATGATVGVEGAAAATVGAAAGGILARLAATTICGMSLPAAAALFLVAAVLLGCAGVAYSMHVSQKEKEATVRKMEQIMREHQLSKAFRPGNI